MSSTNTLLEVVVATWQVRVVNYGVLGTAARSGGTWSSQDVRVAPEPDENMAIVDPCSVKIIRSYPNEAGGASGAIYAFVNILKDKAFPPDVVSAIKREGDVHYHRYGYPKSKHVLHAVSVDFRRGTATVDEAVQTLSAIYENTMRKAARIGRKALRIPPIAAGIYAGHLAPSMPHVTATAFGLGLQRVQDDPDFALFAAEVESVEICIYEQSEVRGFFCVHACSSWGIRVDRPACVRSSGPTVMNSSSSTRRWAPRGTPGRRPPPAGSSFALLTI